MIILMSYPLPALFRVHYIVLIILRFFFKFFRKFFIFPDNLHFVHILRLYFAEKPCRGTGGNKKRVERDRIAFDSFDSRILTAPAPAVILSEAQRS